MVYCEPADVRLLDGSGAVFLIKCNEGNVLTDENFVQVCQPVGLQGTLPFFENCSGLISWSINYGHIFSASL